MGTQTKTIQYRYDSRRNRSVMINHDGGRTSYTYDVVNRLTQVINPQGERTTYSYDAGGRRTVKNMANGTRASFTYDDAGNLTRLYNLKSTGAVVSSFEYKYDKVGNRTAVLEAGGSRVTWSYDQAYQLTGEHRTGANAYRDTYTYDPAGNRLLKTHDGARTTFAYDAANQVSYSQDAGGRTTFTFDADGNQQVVREPAGNRTTYSWDYENRMTLARLPSGIRNTMAYDADGLRVKLEEATGTKKFMWDDQNYLGETDAANDTQVVYTNEPQRYGNLVSQRRGSTSHWYHFDALGSTRELTDSSAVVSDTRLYDAWGNVVATTGSTVSPLRWVGGSGYYYDPDVGLYYVRARVYQPIRARWLSVDPSEFDDGINLFCFSSNSPVYFFDPSGRAVECIAQCLRPDANAREGVVKHAGPRSGTAFAAMGNIRPMQGDKPVGGVASQMTALYHFETQDWRKYWHEPPCTTPQSFDECTCCCTDVTWANVFTTEAKGTRRALDMLRGAYSPLGIGYIDEALPYPLSQSFNPCKTARPTEPAPKQWWSFNDSPGMPLIKRFFNAGGTYVAQKFTTCTYCTLGPEAYVGKPVYMVTYCCIEWGHSVTSKNGKLTVKRWIGSTEQEWDFDGDATAKPGQRAITASPDCAAPTEWFIDAVKNNRVWPIPAPK